MQVTAIEHHPVDFTLQVFLAPNTDASDRNWIRVNHDAIAGLESRVSAILATGPTLSTADLRPTVAGTAT